MNLLKSFFFLAPLAVSAFAQSATIVSPTNGTTVTSGSEIVVVVQQQDALTSILQVAIILGITTCPGNSCPIINPSSPGGVGDVLFSGPWDPQANGPPQLGFHQNFTVEVPQLPSGEALLTLTHLELVGLGGDPVFEQSGVTLNVA